MPRRLLAAMLAGLALAGGGAGGAMKPQHPGHTAPQPRPRDGDVAIRQELEAARQAGRVEAYDLFLARHGDHPLAAAARTERAALAHR